jgi:hypothetical protein
VSIFEHPLNRQDLLGLRWFFVQTVLAEADVELRAGQPQRPGGFGFVEVRVLHRFGDERAFH